MKAQCAVRWNHYSMSKEAYKGLGFLRRYKIFSISSDLSIYTTYIKFQVRDFQQNEIWTKKKFFQWFRLSRFLLKTLRVNEPAMKKSTLSYRSRHPCIKLTYLMCDVRSQFWQSYIYVCMYVSRFDREWMADTSKSILRLINRVVEKAMVLINNNSLSNNKTLQT